MRSLASMTGTGDFIGKTPWQEAAPPRPARGACSWACLRGVTASVDLRREAPASRTCLVEDGDCLIIAGILSDRYSARSIALAPLARQGLRSRRACASRHVSDGCMQA